MITVLSYLEKMGNIALLQEEFHSQAAYHSEEEWKYYLYLKLEELRAALKDDPVLDILCWNIGGKDAIAELEKTRQKYREAFLLLIGSYCSRFKSGEDEEVFLVETREGNRRVPLSQISYIEAREKKIFICTKSESFGFYETIDHMVEILPDNFVRSHRSFIVNMDKAKKLLLSDGMIELDSGETVPLSRSCRKAVREYGKKSVGD